MVGLGGGSERVRFVSCNFVRRVLNGSSFELKFVPPEKLVEAVVYADSSYVDATCNPDEGEPHAYLNLHSL